MRIDQKFRNPKSRQRRPDAADEHPLGNIPLHIEPGNQHSGARADKGARRNIDQRGRAGAFRVVDFQHRNPVRRSGMGANFGRIAARNELHQHRRILAPLICDWKSTGAGSRPGDLVRRGPVAPVVVLVYPGRAERKLQLWIKQISTDPKTGQRRTVAADQHRLGNAYSRRPGDDKADDE